MEVIVTNDDIRNWKRLRLGPFSDEDHAALLRSKGLDPETISKTETRGIDNATIYTGKALRKKAAKKPAKKKH